AAALERARAAAARLDRTSKTQRLDFASFAEMAWQINAQGLELTKVEHFVGALLRGRLGASSVAVLRAATEEGVLVASDGPVRRLEVASPLARRLVELGRPIDLAREGELLGEPAGQPFGELAAVVAPLVQSEGGEKALRGVLVLGPRVTRDGYDARALEFLGQIAELIG